MHEAEALEHLHHMLMAAVKTRSIIMESWSVQSDHEIALLGVDKLGHNKWLFGKYNVIPTLVRILEEGAVEPSDFANLMLIAEWTKLNISVISSGWTPLPDYNTELHVQKWE